jgi:type III restriction enzyme
LTAQLDFTATPRHSKGQLFSWTVYDYPLKQAIIDNVVKRPLKGIAQGITEQRSDVASTRYQAYLAAGVERWKEYGQQLTPLSKKPVLFVMMNDTAEADEVGG